MTFYRDDEGAKICTECNRAECEHDLTTEIFRRSDLEMATCPHRFRNEDRRLQSDISRRGSLNHAIIADYVRHLVLTDQESDPPHALALRDKHLAGVPLDPELRDEGLRRHREVRRHVDAGHRGLPRARGTDHPARHPTDREARPALRAHVRRHERDGDHRLEVPPGRLLRGGPRPVPGPVLHRRGREPLARDVPLPVHVPRGLDSGHGDRLRRAGPDRDLETGDRRPRRGHRVVHERGRVAGRAGQGLHVLPLAVPDRPAGAGAARRRAPCASRTPTTPFARPTSSSRSNGP